jgi:Fanconi anemia group J protein
MPYNYLIDARLRKTFELDFKNTILIIDEAHNIRESAEEVSTFEISQDQLNICISEIDKLL